jgi:hypothetical protein
LLNQRQELAETLTRLWLQEYGTTYTDSINPNLGNLEDVTFFYPPIDTYLHRRLVAAEFRHFVQDFG